MIVVLLVVLGLIFGSFVNAFVWRLHEQEELLGKKKKPAKRQLQELSILRGRSMCPNCKHELAAKDLVPVASWLALGGKCRYCGKPISWQYPVVELLMAVVFALSYVWWPLQLHGTGLMQFIFWLFFAVMFMALAVYDLRWYLLPNKIVYPLIVVALVEALLSALWGHSAGLYWEPVVGAAIIAGLFYVLFLVSRGAWIGGGDVKLGIVLGLLAATPLKAVLVIFLASVVGTIVSLPLAARARQGLKLRVPFGPFLLVATVIVVLFGTSMVDWYTGTFF